MHEPPTEPTDPAPFFAQRLSFARIGVASLLVAVGFAVLSSAAVSPEAPLWQATFLSGSSLAAFAVAGALLTGSDLVRAFGLQKGRFKGWETALVVLGLLGASHLLEIGLRETPAFESSALPKLARRFAIEARGGAQPLSALLLGSAVAAAIGEELFFRGWMLRVLVPAFGRIAALLLSSLAFGVIHGDFLHATAAGILGLYIGGAALRSGSIRAPILCHFANNATSVLAQAGWWLPVAWTDSPESTLASLLAAVAGIAVLARPGSQGSAASAPAARGE